MLKTINSKFYFDNGYIILKPNEKDTVWKAINYLADNFNQNSKDSHFKNKEGIGRQQINIFRKNHRLFENIFQSKVVKDITSSLFKSRFVQIQQSKLSYKIPNKNVDWYPHQDNGYKSIDEKREGLAVFICLENMNEENGALRLYPKSHLLGTMKHNRVIENSKSLSSQLTIAQLPNHLTPITINAPKGSLVIFNANTIHSSGLNKNQNSFRLALIFELEGHEKFKLDDYGLLPNLLKGEPSLIETITIKIKMLVSPKNIFWKLERLGLIKYARLISHKLRKIN